MTILKSKNPRQQQAYADAKKKAEDVIKPPSPKQEKRELLLPHDRDETTGSASTASATAHQESRDTVQQAVEDIERGLKDTERRGIPSDVPPGIGKKRR
ncbi:hypothetical protein [Nitrosospira sp. Nsp13]|jgi:hypothetical protein|uniref:hypothetical protein n=1 Tax=Nitrosospira sp. Nsp13 TaxID=1855332 RepID=UPI000885015D|nr:hypothetical protein [Nitrosospira sp. Nsp13]SCX96559.1 hypothetical protein SAMN05216308_102167 [Nitrosospira sp. Nsp13]